MSSAKQHVNENVMMVRQALRRASDGMELFDNTWDNDVSAFQLDLRQRINEVIYNNVKVGLLRRTASNAFIWSATQLLETYISVESNRKGISISDHGWVLYLLENHLGNTLNQINRRYPNEGGNYNAPNEMIGEALKSVESTKDRVWDIIFRICAAWSPSEHFQIFDSTGQEITHKDSQHPVYSLEFHEDVMINMSEQEWEAERTGLGVAYSTWRIRHPVTHCRLLGFNLRNLRVLSEQWDQSSIKEVEV